MVLGFFVQKRRNKKLIKSFYSSLYKIGKSKKIQLRIFGNLDSEGLLIIKKIEGSFMHFFSQTRLVSDKASVIFHKKNNYLGIEIQLTSQNSFQSFCGNSTGLLKYSFDELREKIERNKGEVVLINRFDHEGAQSMTCLKMIMPLKQIK